MRGAPAFGGVDAIAPNCGLTVNPRDFDYVLAADTLIDLGVIDVRCIS